MKKLCQQQKECQSKKNGCVDSPPTPRLNLMLLRPRPLYMIYPMLFTGDANIVVNRTRSQSSKNSKDGRASY